MSAGDASGPERESAMARAESRKKEADYSHVRFISAGAGSGKTYRLTDELERALVEDGVAPARIIGTTFTVKAAGELRERVRERLIRSGRAELAEQTAQALVGTVHSVCERLLRRFAFELGLSPELDVVSLDDVYVFLTRALDEALSASRVREMNAVAARLGVEDWQRDIKYLIDAARDNDVDADMLAAMGPESAGALLAFFPEPANGDSDAALVAAVRDALKRIDLSADQTKTTAKYVAMLEARNYELRRPPCAWHVWISLSQATAAKGSDQLAADVRRAASRYDCHPRFHSDIRSYIEGTYTIASQTLERFQALKTERGLIDFSDMEQLTLRALDEPAVCEQIGASLGLLLVDEFQDTNPMQLAIFMKLARLADAAIFVGDVKQAIYGFRGCDPDLVFRTLEGLARRRSESDVLPYSWRSRPALVHYINSVFSQAFTGEIPHERVTLKPKREECTDEPAVVRWTIQGNEAERAVALASAVAGFVPSKFNIVDRDTGEVRAARWGDIALLAATNKQVEVIARALRAAHVPMKMTLSGLLAVPEVCLAKACLRRLNNAGDTLATAEIISMADCVEPETWLADRLKHLARDGDSYIWAEEEHPIIASIAALRETISTQSPVEVVARVLNYIGIREVVTAWGPNSIEAMQRQRNLDALLNLAVEYERHCESQHSAATLTGFLFWLEHPHSHELDLQPVVTTGDAVHVLTYHKSKGLEWPVVIATHLDFRWRSRLWDVRVESEPEAFHLDDPLAERAIRFWPRIFGGKESGLPVLDDILASDVGAQCSRQAESESRRLAYVALTRARDALVLAIPDRTPRSGAWLHAFCGDYLLPHGDRHRLADGDEIRTAVVAVEAAGGAQPEAYAPRRLPAREPLTKRVRERVNASAAVPHDGASIGEVIDFSERLPIHGEDMTAIGAGLHALIAAKLTNPGTANAAHWADELLEGYGVHTFVHAGSALAAAARLREWIESRFAPVNIFAEYPVTHRLADGRVVRGWIDVLVETADGCIVIDHKSSPRPKSEWRDEALEHSGQLAAYRAVLEATGKTVRGCWIHFPVSGGIVEIEVRVSGH